VIPQFTCRVLRAGIVLGSLAVGCGGGDDPGPLGQPPAVTGEPYPPVGPGEVLDVKLGNEHACALLEGGRVRCWGQAARGRLGYGNTRNIGDDESPAAAGDVDFGGTATAIAVGSQHTCVLLTTGAVRCWGSGVWGEHGYGHKNDVGDDETPATAGDVSVGGKALAISAGGLKACVLLETGRVRCWGNGFNGALGTAQQAQAVGDNELPSSTPEVPLPARAVAIDSGLSDTCALLENRQVICWGGTHKTYNPTVIPLPSMVNALAPGSNHLCATLESGRLRCWGNGFGTANDYLKGTAPAPPTDVDVPIGEPVLAADAGEDTTCVLLDQGAVRCWGRNDYGQLGLAHTRSSGVKEVANVSLGARAKRIRAGRLFTCALFESQHVKCWGANEDGQLGYGHRFRIGEDESPYDVGYLEISGPGFR
jgi:alpha-tubulin suppressor-like RCC1 family protein